VTNVRKEVLKVQSLILVLVMLETLFQFSPVFSAAELEVIYENGFETDASAVTVGDTKALEFDVKGDVSNSWVTVFMKDLWQQCWGLMHWL
jgi:hypothetical protein